LESEFFRFSFDKRWAFLDFQNAKYFEPSKVQKPNFFEKRVFFSFHLIKDGLFWIFKTQSILSQVKYKKPNFFEKRVSLVFI